jgi:uncharacterized protein (DUF2252 family)
MAAERSTPGTAGGKLSRAARGDGSRRRAGSSGTASRAGSTKGAGTARRAGSSEGAGTAGRAAASRSAAAAPAGPVAQAIERFNAGRDPERLALKYKALRARAFGFFRGTGHLFCDDWRARRSDAPEAAPIVFACGDLHWENFGAFKGDNRLTYFDINDFDEACVAPATFDLARLVASVFVGSEELGIDARQAAQLARQLVDAYAAALATGKPRWLERTLAEGAIGALLTGLQQRRRAAFLNSRTHLRGGRRRLIFDGIHELPASDEQRARAEALVRRFAESQPRPELFKIRDIGRRIAGTSSLGLERYGVIVRGIGDPDGNLLLDVKLQPGSVPAGLFPQMQHRWPCEGARVVSMQRTMQAISPAFLTAVDSFVVRELQPVEDRLSLRVLRGRPRRIEGVMHAMAAELAWDQLRSASRCGAASWDELTAFGARRDWRGPLIAYAREAARVSMRQWHQFRR